jgi:hypothetical protein
MNVIIFTENFCHVSPPTAVPPPPPTHTHTPKNWGRSLYLLPPVRRPPAQHCNTERSVINRLLQDVPGENCDIKSNAALQSAFVTSD